MTVWRWRTTGVPTWGGQPVSAFMPLITKTQETWQSFKDHVNGQPGTLPVPAPDNGIPRSPLFVGAGQAYARDFGGNWFPQVWYQDGQPGFATAQYPAGGNDSGVCIFSDNQLPVPAIEPQRGTHRLGGGQVAPVFMDPRRRVITQRTVQPRNA